MAEATPDQRLSHVRAFFARRGQMQPGDQAESAEQTEMWDKMLKAANLLYESRDPERSLEQVRENLKHDYLGERWAIGNLLIALDAKTAWDGEAQQFYYAAGGAIAMYAQKVKDWTDAALEDVAQLKRVYGNFAEQRRREGADAIPSGPPRPRPAEEGSGEPTGDLPPKRSRTSAPATRKHRLASSGTRVCLRWIALANKVDLGTIDSIPEEEEPIEDAPEMS
jgi:hypothetical protein